VTDDGPCEISVWRPMPYRCPICDGTGMVLRPPWVAGDVQQWASTGAGPYPCRPCSGGGIIWSKEAKS